MILLAWAVSGISSSSRLDAWKNADDGANMSSDTRRENDTELEYQAQENGGWRLVLELFCGAQ